MTVIHTPPIRSVNDKEEVQAYLTDLLGPEAVANMEKQLSLSIPEAPKFTDFKGYTKAVAKAREIVEGLRGKVFHCPSSTGKNTTGAGWFDLSDGVGRWTSTDFSSNAKDVIGYVLAEATRRRVQYATKYVYNEIEKRAEAMDKVAEKRIENLAVLLRAALTVEQGSAYEGNEQRFLRHLSKASEDIMDQYFPFFAPVQAVLNRVDNGNRKLAASVEALAGKDSESYIKETIKGSILGSSISLEIPVPVATLTTIPPYLQVNLTNEGIKFFRITSKGEQRQDFDGLDDGVVTEDVTDKCLRILAALMKG